MSLCDRFRIRAGWFGFGLLLAFVAAVSPAWATPPSAPPLTIDSTLPNLFYGAVPPSGPNGPVIVYVHGLGGDFQDWIESANCPANVVGGCTGSSNDMYDYAYQAGFRTAFMSLNSNNTPNNSSIQTNSAVLQTMFPLILSHFGVSKVFFVCHSKGGLDLEDAIANPAWLNIANMVITMGTPNQGDALASWIYLPANQALGKTLGLLTPAVQSMEISNVEQLRTQWDPIFQTSGIPFYTLSGNTDLCPNGGTSCSIYYTGQLLTEITGGSSAPPNDGLVDHPETLLPESYATEIGIVHCEHYQLRLGDETFSFINAQVLAFQNQQPGFTRVSTNGFGDFHNTWAWSMAWFNNMLYVGTGREVYCVTSETAAQQLGIPGLYPPAIGDCPTDYHYLPLQAEIWQYNPATAVWTRVFQSPASLTTTDNNGNTVATARDIGFRSLTVVTEPGGVQALYAGGVTSGEIFEAANAFGTWPPPRILRSTDGVTWNPLPQDAGTFLGELTQNGTPQYPNYSIRSGGQLNGVLFLQVGDFPGVGRVMSSIPGANPAGGDNNYQWASPPTAQLPIWILEEFNNFMYAGAGNPPGAGPAVYGVWKTDGTGTAPYNWTEIIPDGGFATGLVSDYAMSMRIYSDPVYCPGIGCLYAGTDRPNELVRIHPDATGNVPVDSVDSWDLLVGNPRTVPPGYTGAGLYVAPLSGIGQYFNNGFTGHFWNMGVGNYGLYMGTWDWSADDYIEPTFAPLWSQEFGTDLWRTPDGVSWQLVSKVGLGAGFNTGSRSFAATPYGLFLGTAREVGGTQIFQLDSGASDINNDGIIDMADVNLLASRVGQKVRPNDPLDLDGDGKITAKDVEILRAHCTLPACAAPALKPAGITLASPLLSSAPGQLGGTVNISWTPVSGAVDYLVYRIALSSSETVVPPGDPVPVGTSISSLAAKVRDTCHSSAARPICTMLPAAQPAQSTTAYGYPGPPQYLTRVTGTTYSETPPSTLQALYYVVAEDASGDLSTSSNIVGGPSLAAQ